MRFKKCTSQMILITSTSISIRERKVLGTRTLNMHEYSLKYRKQANF